MAVATQPQYQMYQQMPMGNMHQQLMYQQPRQIYMQQPPPAPPQPQVTPAEIYVQQQAAFAMATCAVALQQQFVQSPPPRVASPTSAPSSICRTWAKLGRCHCKGCPLAASHTAYNSPRYRSHGVDSNPSSPRKENSPPRAPRANALLIVDPSEKSESSNESDSDVEEKDELKEEEEVSAPVFSLPRPRSLEASRPPSPQGSRLGKWLCAQ